MNGLIQAIQAVLADGGDRSAEETLRELRRVGRSPKDSDPLGRVRYELAANKNVFERIHGCRGRYRLRRRPSA